MRLSAAGIDTSRLIRKDAQKGLWPGAGSSYGRTQTKKERHYRTRNNESKDRKLFCVVLRSAPRSDASPSVPPHSRLKLRPS